MVQGLHLGNAIYLGFNKLTAIFTVINIKERRKSIMHNMQIENFVKRFADEQNRQPSVEEIYENLKDEIDEIHLFIKEFMKRKYNVDDISVLYGGSVNSKNSREIFSLVNVNGGLIGGASLIASEFCKIYDTL